MNLQLHFHPLSSYCHKVLIALYEFGLAFDGRLLNLGDAAEREAFFELWPLGKMPLLVDGATAVPESSIIIEHLQQHHAPAMQLLPRHAGACLEARLWDRIVDNYVMTPMQAVVAQQLRAEAERDEKAETSATQALATAYATLERHLEDGREWLAGDMFTVADCAAAPALFFASTILPFAEGQVRLTSYFERLVSRPSVRRVLEEAKPWLKYYPLYERIHPRFTAG